GFEDGLGKLVSVLSDGPLPLEDVLKWFTTTGLPCSAPFQELPRTVPAGCLYTPENVEVRRRTSSRSSSMLSFGGSRGSGPRRASGSSCTGDDGSDSPRGARALGFAPRPGGSNGISLFGQAARRDSSDGSSLLMSNTEAAETDAHGPVSNSEAIGLASEGAVCDLRIEQDGAYGAFCEAWISLEDVTPSSDLRVEDGPSRMRWAHLVKASPEAAPQYRAPYFQLLEFQPTQAVGAEAAISVPLFKLKEVLQLSASSMALIFASEGRQIRYTLKFECPSHVFRFRLVLQSWSAVDPGKELGPVVAFMSGGQGLEELEEYGWRNLSPALTWQVLEQRLGGLWREVRKRLEAS
ncbi:Uncharacterized protein SCF082_LOCUS44589, partial [Durusdinium trenchii]